MHNSFITIKIINTHLTTTQSRCCYSPHPTHKFPHYQQLIFYCLFPMKMVEYEIIILVSWIIDFANFFKFLQKNTSSKFVLQELWGLLQNLSNSFKIWPAKINKAVTTFQALRFRMNRIKQIYVSWKSIMQFTWTIFPNSVTLILSASLKKSVQKICCGGKVDFANVTLDFKSSQVSSPSRLRWSWSLRLVMVAGHTLQAACQWAAQPAGPDLGQATR